MADKDDHNGTMAHERLIIGSCPRCQAAGFACSYNQFVRAELTINSWEHRCTDCGFRATKAYRSDQPQPDGAAVDPTECPFCFRRPQPAP